MEMSDRREISHGRHFAVARALLDSKRVIVKTVAPEETDPAAVATLEHEYAVLESLSLPGIARAIALTHVEGSLALVMADAGPRTLRESLQGPLPVGAFLDLAVDLARILERLHARNIAHCDLNPSNIVLGSDGRATLIDFHRAATVPVVVGGTLGLASELAYLSPEQTGRMNRLIDQRSDLYSLGAIFYELLTGSPPFRADDAQALVHAHLARLPISPSVVAAHLPTQLSMIVLRLLAKMPEARYQSAAALAFDLEEARRRWRDTRAIAPFDLGTLDLLLQLPLPERLYGRQREVEQLEAALARAHRGRCETVLITGEAGIGKSALVQALRTQVTARQGLFVSGKFDPRAANVPFASLVEALATLVQVLATSSDRPHLKERVRAEVGENAGFLSGVVPTLETVLGRPPPLPELPPQEARHRLHLTLEAFLQSFATESHPLVLFLDDLQWADAATLDALAALASAPDLRHVLLIASFRSGEAAAPQSLASLVDELRRSGASVAQLDLPPLAEEAVHALLADALSCELGRVWPLAELVFRKTGGNPFFIRQLLRSLQKAGVLAFDMGEGSWRWDIARVHEIGLTDNVVDLLVASIERLPPETRALVELAACLGKRIDLGILARLAARSPEDTRLGVQPAVQEGLLFAEASPTQSGVAYRFAHDRVQQAVYSLVASEARGETHLRIAQELERSEGGAEESLFEVVDQRNLGAGLLTTSSRLELARLNLKAGLKAKQRVAYGPALAYLRSAIAFCPDDAWTREHPLFFTLHCEAAECAYLAGDYAVSDALVESALVHAVSPTEEARLFNLRAVSAGSRADWNEAVRQGTAGLRALGYQIPKGDVAPLAAEEEKAVSSLLEERGVERLLDLPAIEAPSEKAVLELLGNLMHPAYFQSRALFRWLTATALRFVLQRGSGPELATACANWALCLAAVDAFRDADRASRVGGELARRAGNRRQEAYVLMTDAGFVRGWLSPYRVVLSKLDQAVALAKQSGEMRVAAYGLDLRILNALAAGRELDQLLADIDADASFLQKSRNAVAIAYHLQIRQMVRCLKGRTRGRNRFDDAGFDEAAHLEGLRNMPALTCMYEIRRLHTSVLLRDFPGALLHAERARPLIEYVGGYYPTVEYSVYRALALAALAETASGDQRAEWLEALASTQRRCARWAESCPENFEHLACLLKAEQLRLEGRVGASDRYDRAIEAAARQGILHEEALANEIKGRFERARGRETIAELFLRRARERYLRWGALEKVAALDEEFQGRHAPSIAVALPRERDLDLGSLLEAAEAISTEVVLEDLLQRLIQVCAEAAGAERVSLLLEEDGQPFLRAAGSATAPATFERTPLAEAEGLLRGPVERVRASRQPLLFNDAAHDPRAAGEAGMTTSTPKSVLIVPVQHQTSLVATLYLENNLTTHAFTPARTRVIELLSAQIAISLENGLLFDRLTHEVAERSRAEASLRLLAEASADLARSLELPAILDTISRRFVPSLGDWCVIDLVGEEGRLERVAARHRDESKAVLVRQMLSFSPERDSPQPAATVLRTGAPLLVNDLSQGGADVFARDAKNAWLVRALGVRSCMAVPLIGHARALGVITCVLADRNNTAANLLLAQELAHRAAFAIENARLLQKANQAVAIRDEFLSVAAHELKTPITSLNISLKALLQRRVAPASEAAERFLQVIERQVHRLARLTDEMLDVSRIEAHRLSLDLEWFDMAALARECAELFADEARRAGSPLIVHADQPALGLWDRSRVEHVLSNLLSNAIKFGAGQAIELAVSQDGDRVRLSVRDHGIGISHDRLPHIFDRFERAVSARQYGGLGLGLYIARRVVEALGGTVTVESTAGVGSTFVVEFPSHVAQHAPAPGV